MLIRCVARFHVWQFLVTVPVGIIVEDLSSGNSRYQFLVASLGTWHPLQNSGALLLTSVFCVCVVKHSHRIHVCRIYLHTYLKKDYPTSPIVMVQWKIYTRKETFIFHWTVTMGGVEYPKASTRVSPKKPKCLPALPQKSTKRRVNHSHGSHGDCRETMLGFQLLANAWDHRLEAWLFSSPLARLDLNFSEQVFLRESPNCKRNIIF